VFAASDTLASGIMRGLQEAGIRIPADVTIVGFDGGFGARQSTPALTTIEQDVASAGEMLVEALFGQAEPVGRTGKAFVPVQLVVRGSS
jgi:DNA-binding LacI/PurR family transcriptional regulator